MTTVITNVSETRRSSRADLWRSLAAFEVALSVPSPGPARLPHLTADAHETRGDGAWRTPHNGA